MGPMDGKSSPEALDWNLTADSMSRGCTAVHAPSKGSEPCSSLRPRRSKPLSNMDSQSARESLSDWKFSITSLAMESSSPSSRISEISPYHSAISSEASIFTVSSEKSTVTPPSSGSSSNVAPLSSSGMGIEITLPTSSGIISYGFLSVAINFPA